MLKQKYFDDMSLVFPVKPKVFDWIYLFLFSTLAFFIPLVKIAVVYIIALVLIVWLAEKVWYFIAVLIYVACVWHTGSALYIATGIVGVIALLEVVFLYL